VAAGFALLAPTASVVELYYLAVDPDIWGAGVARALLTRVDSEARALGFDALELWVIDDNHRAIAVYERSGWIRTEHTQRDSPRSRLERRFVKQLNSASVMHSQ
jgi:GNAT superfamily N-acetyltransferase